jgi:hypothetical protein
LCHLWDNVEKYVRPKRATDDNIIQCMCFACWVTKATMYCFSMAAMFMWTHLNITLYVHCLLFIMLGNIKQYIHKTFTCLRESHKTKMHISL